MSAKMEKVKKGYEKQPTKEKEVNKVDSGSFWKVRDLVKDLAEKQLKGEYLDQLLPGEVIEVVTQNHTYLIERYGENYYISGHPDFCPVPTKVRISGSNWGGTALKMGFVGEDMQLEFVLPDGQRVVTSFTEKVTKKQLSRIIQ